MRVIQILCQFQAYKLKGQVAPPKKIQILAYNQEKIYFSIVADFFLAKSLLLVSFPGRKCEILAKSHNTLGYINQFKIP